MSTRRLLGPPGEDTTPQPKPRAQPVVDLRVAPGPQSRLPLDRSVLNQYRCSLTDPGPWLTRRSRYYSRRVDTLRRLGHQPTASTSPDGDAVAARYMDIRRRYEKLEALSPRHEFLLNEPTPAHGNSAISSSSPPLRCPLPRRLPESTAMWDTCGVRGASGRWRRFGRMLVNITQRQTPAPAIHAGANAIGPHTSQQQNGMRPDAGIVEVAAIHPFLWSSVALMYPGIFVLSAAVLAAIAGFVSAQSPSLSDAAAFSLTLTSVLLMGIFGVTVIYLIRFAVPNDIRLLGVDEGEQPLLLASILESVGPAEFMISYRHEHAYQRLARSLAHTLPPGSTWLDLQQMAAGDRLPEKTRYHAAYCRVLVIFFTEGYLGSDSCTREMLSALRYRRYPTHTFILMEPQEGATLWQGGCKLWHELRILFLEAGFTVCSSVDAVIAAVDRHGLHCDSADEQTDDIFSQLSTPCDLVRIACRPADSYLSELRGQDMPEHPQIEVACPTGYDPALRDREACLGWFTSFGQAVRRVTTDAYTFAIPPPMRGEMWAIRTARTLRCSTRPGWLAAGHHALSGDGSTMVQERLITEKSAWTTALAIMFGGIAVWQMEQLASIQGLDDTSSDGAVLHTGLVRCFLVLALASCLAIQYIHYITPKRDYRHLVSRRAMPLVVAAHLNEGFSRRQRHQHGDGSGDASDASSPNGEPRSGDPSVTTRPLPKQLAPFSPHGPIWAAKAVAGSSGLKEHRPAVRPAVPSTPSLPPFAVYLVQPAAVQHRIGTALAGSTTAAGASVAEGMSITLRNLAAWLRAGIGLTVHECVSLQALRLQRDSGDAQPCTCRCGQPAADSAATGSNVSASVRKVERQMHPRPFAIYLFTISARQDAEDFHAATAAATAAAPPATVAAASVATGATGAVSPRSGAGAMPMPRPGASAPLWVPARMVTFVHPSVVFPPSRPHNANAAPPEAVAPLASAVVASIADTLFVAFKGDAEDSGAAEADSVTQQLVHALARKVAAVFELHGREVAAELAASGDTRG